MKINQIIPILKTLIDLCAIRQNILIKNAFVDIFHNFLVMKKYKTSKNCLTINGKQSVKLKIGSIKFKIHVECECFLKKVRSKTNNKNKNASLTKKIKLTFLTVLPTKFFVLIINLAKKLMFLKKKCGHKTIEAILKEYKYCKESNKKVFQ